MDFTWLSITDAALIVTGLGTIAGIRLLPRAASWGYRTVLGFIPGKG